MHDGSVRQLKIVQFTPNDPGDPKNWSKARKWLITMTLGMVCFSVAFASAVVTPGIAGVAEEFHVSQEVALLTVALFVYGFGIGRAFPPPQRRPFVARRSLADQPALVFSPLSELYGRWIVYVATFGLAVVFIVPCAVAKNIQTLLVCRAIDGIAISVPIANVSTRQAWKKNGICN